MKHVIDTVEDDENGPANEFEVVLRFKFKSDYFELNDGAEDELASFELDPIGTTFDFYLAGDYEVAEVVVASINALRNSEEKNNFLLEAAGLL